MSHANLADTVDGMLSTDYRKRFVAEYEQLRTRYWKLNDMLVKMADGDLGFEPACSYELLSAQRNVMSAYMAIMEERARLEGIEL